MRTVGTKAEEFVAELASFHRVVVISGLAVIAYGQNRSTKDAGIWLEPFSSAEEWGEKIYQFCGKYPELTLHGLPGWKLLELFDRFLDWRVCEQALKNPSQEVKDYTLLCLKEMAGEGDPFSQAILDNRPIPYTYSPPSH